MVRVESTHRRWLRHVLGGAAVVLITVALVWGARQIIPPGNVCPDFIQFWTTATLMKSHKNFYDPALQAATQQPLGWKRADQGLGVYDFLPYYYPPWLGFAFLPLLPLGYSLAKLTWLVVGGELLLASAALLKGTVRGVSPFVVFATVVCFGFSIKSVAMGQVAPLVLLLVAACWRLLERRRDDAAGCVLALLTIKPQLTVLLIGALLAWAQRQGRLAVLRGFAATLAALALASTIVHPGWLAAMIAAPTVTPMTLVHFPGLGTSWFIVLTSLGLGGAPLYVVWALVALPVLALLARTALGREARLEDIFGLALLATFFVTPYARGYDLPVLLVPALILVGSRLSSLSATMMVLALILLPTLHIIWIANDDIIHTVRQRWPEFTYFWIPLLIGAAWCTAAPDRKSAELSRDS